MPTKTPGEAFAETFNPAGLAQLQLQISGQQQTQELRNIQEQRLHMQEQQQQFTQQREMVLGQIKVLGEAFKGANPIQQQTILKRMLETSGLNLPDSFYPNANELAENMTILANAGPDSSSGQTAAAKVIQLLPADTAKLALEQVEKKRQATGFGTFAERAGVKDITGPEASALASSPQMQQELGKETFIGPVAKAAAHKLDEAAKRIEMLNQINVATIKTLAPSETEAEQNIAEARPFLKAFNQVSSTKDSKLRSQFENAVPQDQSRISLKSYKEQVKPKADAAAKALVELQPQLNEIVTSLKVVKETMQEESPEYIKTLLQRDVLERAVALKKAEEAYFTEPGPQTFQKYDRELQAMHSFHEKISKDNRNQKNELMGLQQQRLTLAQTRAGTAEARDYQTMYDNIFKSAAYEAQESLGGISIKTGEGGGLESLQIGGQIKDPVRFGEAIVAQANIQTWLPQAVRTATIAYGQRLIAQGKGGTKPTAPVASKQNLEKKLGLQ